MARWGQMPFGSNTHQGGLRRLGCINRGKTRFERGLSMHPTGRPANFDTTRPATQAHEPKRRIKPGEPDSQKKRNSEESPASGGAGLNRL
jgi:hypothetical protein